MADTSRTFAELLLQGAREAAAYARGAPGAIRSARVTRRPLTAREVHLHRPAPPSAAEIRKIRNRMAISQTVFGDLLNVSTATVRAWEQGKRVPDGPSLRLLEIAEGQPSALLNAATGRKKPPARTSSTS